MTHNQLTEQQMRKADVPTLDTTQELAAYIESLTDREHDYGTCVYAMSMAAVAAFNHVARKLGVTGFQASCADLDVLRRTRQLDCPFMLIKASDMLYPQYDIENDVRAAQHEWLPWAADEARKLLAGDITHTSQGVLERWRQLALLPGREAKT